ncbi:hypothetical protein MHBO_001225 [Bonamia ostreae]|uniref:Sm protein G n=1 Tax=Bonamia ostreae TaxID=126728 RepID=A0ABV2AI69_9EUKA
MGKSAGPELKHYMDKILDLKLRGKIQIRGNMRGFDQFMNVVLSDAVHFVTNNDRRQLGTIAVRGNSILAIEVVDMIN